MAAFVFEEPYWQQATEEVARVLESHRVKFEPFSAHRWNPRVLVAAFRIEGEPYEIAVADDGVVMFGGEKGERLFECYEMNEYANADAHITAFITRLDRFLRGNGWD